MISNYVKRLVKKLVPKVLANQVRGTTNSEDSTHIWEGIYDHYSDVPVVGEGFDGEAWARETLAYTMSLLPGSNGRANVTVSATEESRLLAVLASMVGSEFKEVSVLDFGGALGASYIILNSALKDSASIKYVVIERDNICRLGRKLFDRDAQIRFCAELPADPGNIDIVYICSALQYVEDYRSLLSSLCAYRSKYILLAKTSAGDIPTYATAQLNIKGSAIPFWFINVNELVHILEAAGFSLILNLVLEREYFQGNFPEGYRLKHACDLLFSQSR